MKNSTFFILVYFTVIKLWSQDYQLNFMATGEENFIDTVKVENMDQGTKLTLQGNQVLHLSNSITEAFLPELNRGNKISFYPNPMPGYTSMEFDLLSEGDVKMALIDCSGKIITHTNRHLPAGRQIYRLTGIQQGFYTVRIITAKEMFSGKLVCCSDNAGKPEMIYLETDLPETDFNEVKSSGNEIEMQYNDGERLKFTAITGKFSAVMVHVPVKSTILFFYMYDCTDNGGRSYPVVLIGKKLWMAENLAYLPEVDPSNSTSQTETRYYVYNYQDTDVKGAVKDSNYKVYGVLYNWPAAKSACPSGWHLPGVAEWQQLEMTLGMEQSQADSTGWHGTNQGALMKESEGWLNSGNGTNLSGFSALPGGVRSINNYFHYLGSRGHWWSSTDVLAVFAAYVALDADNKKVFRSNTSKENGYSVRCIRD